MNVRGDKDHVISPYNMLDCSSNHIRGDVYGCICKVSSIPEIKFPGSTYIFVFPRLSLNFGHCLIVKGNYNSMRIDRNK